MSLRKALYEYTLEQYCKIDVIDQGHIFMFQLFKQFCFIDIPSHKRFFIYRVSDIGYVHVHHVLSNGNEEEEKRFNVKGK